MNTYQLSAIYIYPIKAFGPIQLQEAKAVATGLEYDRRWMLVDENHLFISQRTFPELTFYDVMLASDGLDVGDRRVSDTRVHIPFVPKTANRLEVEVWGSRVESIEVGEDISAWFSEKLGTNCKLVYMPDSSHRQVDPDYAMEGEGVSFADGYPFLILGEASLGLLNSKLAEQVEMLRFRPNFVFTGGKPHDEDTWRKFELGELTFRVVKPCGRCTVPTVNLDTGEPGPEPLRTLATYRRQGKNVMFGMNLLHTPKTGMLKVGDILKIID